MKKKTIDANHLKTRIETEYGNYSWYDLVKIMALIDTEPLEKDNITMRGVIFAETIVIAALIILLAVSAM